MLDAKQWRFERVIPSLTIIFGLITLGGGFVHNAAGLIGTRVILGLFQGCLFPALALFVANWYKREELAVRMAFLFGMFQVYFPMAESHGLFQDRPLWPELLVGYWRSKSVLGAVEDATV